MDINKNLADALGRSYVERENGDLCYDIFRYDGDWESWKVFNYKDPAIFAECVTWLLDNGYGLAKDREKGHIPRYLVYRIGGSISGDIYSKDLFKAVALAVIQAKV